MKKRLFLMGICIFATSLVGSAKKAVVVSTLQLPPAEAIYNEGINLLRQKQYDDAIIKFTATIAEDTTFTKAYYNRAIANFESERYNKAMNDLNVAIRQANNETASECYLLRGKIMFHLDDIKNALTDLDKAIELNPSNINARLDKAALLQYKREYALAEEEYSNILNISPDNASALLERGNCRQYIGQLEAAMNDYKILAINDSSNFQAKLNIATLTWKISADTVNSISLLNKLAKDNPQSAEVFNARGLIYSLTAQYDSAIADFDKAIAINKNYAAAYNNRGSAYYKQNKLETAIDNYNRAIEINTNYGDAYLNRAIVRELLRDENGSCNDLKAAAKLGVKNASEYFTKQCE
ncbi:MAG TPA: tetratricopeptide repeat protein [Candidatus Enterocola sp.]|nr:tetratricopeptide repeat protein [Candidatus Enterocola sp.]